MIPKSVSEARIKSNFEIDGLELTEEDMKTIDSMEGRFKVCGDDWLPNVKVFFGDDE